ncbi:uncharacterized protein LOC126473580 [Schistocerca serialis cubense]|uniref:uncharacterized protein LOC126473580 n=1 Tax=Schistocerca serialis cubense TaxID=2023355 RepID=UPI00214E43BB|nr:uncharacterized protein LOC126473580 [Schistocerca serialis cubense]
MPDKSNCHSPANSGKLTPVTMVLEVSEKIGDENPRKDGPVSPHIAEQGVDVSGNNEMANSVNFQKRPFCTMEVTEVDVHTEPDADHDEETGLNDVRSDNTSEGDPMDLSSMIVLDEVGPTSSPEPEYPEKICLTVLDEVGHVDSIDENEELLRTKLLESICEKSRSAKQKEIGSESQSQKPVSRQSAIVIPKKLPSVKREKSVAKSVHNSTLRTRGAFKRSLKPAFTRRKYSSLSHRQEQGSSDRFKKQKELVSYRKPVRRSQTNNGSLQVTVAMTESKGNSTKRKIIPFDGGKAVERFVIRLDEDTDSGEDDGGKQTVSSGEHRVVHISEHANSKLQNSARSSEIFPVSGYKEDSQNSEPTALLHVEGPLACSTLGTEVVPAAKEFEESLDILLKQARSEAEARGMGEVKCVATANNPIQIHTVADNSLVPGLQRKDRTVTIRDMPLTATPLAVRFLPSSRQEEYRRLKEQLALKQRQLQTTIAKPSLQLSSTEVKGETMTVKKSTHKLIRKNVAPGGKSVLMSKVSPVVVTQGHGTIGTVSKQVNTTLMKTSQSVTNIKAVAGTASNEITRIGSPNRNIADKFRNFSLNVKISDSGTRIVEASGIKVNAQNANLRTGTSLPVIEQTDLRSNSISPVVKPPMNYSPKSIKMERTFSIKSKVLDMQHSSVTLKNKNVELPSAGNLLKSPKNLIESKNSHNGGNKELLSSAAKTLSGVQKGTDKSSPEIFSVSASTSAVPAKQQPMMQKVPKDVLESTSSQANQPMRKDDKSALNRTVLEARQLEAAVRAKLQDYRKRKSTVESKKQMGNIATQVSSPMRKTSVEQRKFNAGSLLNSECVKHKSVAETSSTSDQSCGKGSNSNTEPDKGSNVQLMQLENNLLKERCAVLDDMSELSNLLQQIEKEKTVESDCEDEIEQLRAKLQMAEERLLKQKKILSEMRNHAKEARQRINKRFNNYNSLVRECHRFGQKTVGGSYKVPSGCSQLLVEKVKQLSVQAKRLNSKCAKSGDETSVTESPLSGVEASDMCEISFDESQSDSPDLKTGKVKGSDSEDVNGIDMRSPVRNADQSGRTEASVESSPMENSADKKTQKCYIESELKEVTTGVKRKSSDVCSSQSKLHTPRKLQKYVSPLEHIKTDSGLGVDPNVVLCPYELSGTCHDEECPYQHQQQAIL